MNAKLMLMLGLVGSVVMTGCRTPTTYVDTQNDTREVATGMDYRDLERAASQMVQSLMRSGRLDRADGGAYVLAVSEVTNDTMQRGFDTSTLTSYITEELMNSGKVMVTSALEVTPGQRDKMITAARSVRGDAEFNQSTVAKQGQLVAPTHSLKGKIIERHPSLGNGDKQIEYWFQLQIVDLATGLQWWQKQVKIVKNADGKAATW